MTGMFHSLYQRQKTTAEPAAESRVRILTAWPASYAGGLSMVDPDSWTVEVDGLVERPQRFNLKDLAGFTRIQQNRRLVFADGWTFRAQWEGFVLPELLHRVSPRPEARYLHQTDTAGHIECLPVQDLITQRALFCMRVDGQALPSLHGGPLRLMVFDRYAHKGLSQIVRLTFSDQELPGHWAGKGYDPRGEIEPGSYYAADLRIMQSVRSAGEITQW